MAPSPASGSDASGTPGPHVFFQLPHSVENFIAQNGARRDVQRFVALPGYTGRLSITHNHHNQDGAAGAWREQLKHWGGLFASKYRTASLEKNIPFVRCTEEVN